MHDGGALQAVGRTEWLERARALAPVLRERADAAEALRRLPDETVADLHRSGLLRILQPARVGGGEADYGLMLEITAELARGCGSTGWVYVNLASHHWMLAMWPAEGQARVWDEDPDALIASSVVFPAGRAARREGGYLLTGRWPFSSGIDPSGWAMLGASVPPDEGEGGPEARLFLVPKAELAVIDNWDVSGLAATGSKDVACEDAFVPEAMTVRASDLRGGPTPGAAVNPSPLYRLPVLGLFAHLVAAPALGIATAAYEDFREQVGGARSTYNRSRLAEHTTIHLKLAEAGAAVDAARMLLLENCAEARRIYETGALADALAKHRWRRDAAFAARLCGQAVDVVVAASGGRAIFRANPLQRYFRDVHAALSHIGLSWDINGADFGRVALGLPGNPAV